MGDLTLTDDIIEDMRYKLHWISITIIAAYCIQSLVGYWQGLLVIPLVLWIVMPMVERGNPK